MKVLLTLVVLFSAFALSAAVKPAPPADLASPPSSADREESGLAWRTLNAGSGSENPTDSDILKMRYTVWQSDGAVVTHIPPQQSVMVPMMNMLPGWRQTARKMVVGETQRAWVPSSLGGGKIRDGEQFVIDTELIEIVHTPPTPSDVAEPPADAVHTKSGLAYKILRDGDGSAHPRKSNKVVVHYSGWTSDGKLFDSSVLRGEPASFGLRDVIAGWTEGLQLMSIGEKRRFWIPARLAYGRERGKPQGMLVFDIELIEMR